MDLQEKRWRVHGVSAAIWRAFALWLIISCLGLWEFASGHAAKAYIDQAGSRMREDARPHFFRRFLPSHAALVCRSCLVTTSTSQWIRSNLMRLV